MRKWRSSREASCQPPKIWRARFSGGCAGFRRQRCSGSASRRPARTVSRLGMTPWLPALCEGLRSKRTMSETSEILVPGVAGGESVAELVRKMLVQLGEDPDREGLRQTPERFEKALRFLTSGYQQDPDKILNGAMF